MTELQDLLARAENLPALEGLVAKALGLSEEQAIVARGALKEANAALLYWREFAELAIAVHEDDEKRVVLLREALKRLLDAPTPDEWLAADKERTTARDMAHQALRLTT